MSIEKTDLPLMALFEDDQEPTSFDKFNQFHKDNPNVYTELVKWAKACKYDYGHQSIGFPLVWNIVRCLSQIQTKGAEAIEFKMNNIFAPYYSRLIMATQEDLEGYFEIRKSDADNYEYAGIEVPK